MTLFRTLAAVLSLAVTPVAFATGAAAQEASGQAAASTESAEELAGIDEILVYSRKRQESLQDVPVAVTAFDLEAIESVAPSTLRDFDGLAPNVFIGQQNSGVGQAAIYFRGQGYSDVDRTQAPPVGVLIDNVFLGTSTGQILDTFDIEHVELNRGPQTVLFGKNTTGGTISVRRKRPQLDGYGGQIKATFGNFDGPGDGNIWTIQGVANLPIIENELALRVGYVRKDGDGYTQNALTGRNSGGIDYEAVNAKLLWQPTEDFQLLLNWDWMQDRGELKHQDAIFDGDSPHMGRADRDPPEDLAFDAQIFSMEITWDTAIGTFESVTAYVDSTDKALQDFDGGVCGATNSQCFPTPALAPHPGPIDPNTPFAQLHTTRSQAFDQFSQELRLTQGFFDDRLTLSGGVYLWHHDHKIRQETDQVIQIPTPFPVLTCPFVPGFANGAVVNGVQWCLIGFPHVTQETREQDDTWSVFAAFELAITENWNFSAGGRYIDEEKDFTTSFRTPTTVLVSGVDEKDSWSDFVFEASSDYHITDDVMVYVSYGQGFRSGGFSNRGFVPSQLTYDPENVEEYEIGLRSTWLDGGLVVNLSAFTSTTEDAQGISIIQTPGQGPGTNTFQLNSTGDVEIDGVELETTWYPIPELRLYGIAGYLTGDIGENLQPDTLLPVGPNGTAGTTGALIDVGGGQLVRSPKFSFTVGATFTAELGPGALIWDVRWKHQDDVIFIPSTILPFGIDSYNLVDTTIGYDFVFDGNDWRVALVGKNLGNTEYIEQALPSVGFQTWGPPRYVGLEIGVEF